MKYSLFIFRMFLCMEYINDLFIRLSFPSTESPAHILSVILKFQSERPLSLIDIAILPLLLSIIIKLNFKYHSPFSFILRHMTEISNLVFLLLLFNIHFSEHIRQDQHAQSIMLSHLCLWMTAVLVVAYVNALPAPLADADLQNQKFSAATMIERLGPNRFLVNRPYDDEENIDEDEMLHAKRQLKKKWAKFYQGPQSPYTIAFPALIRTRRWIE